MKTIVLLCVTFSLAYGDPSTTSPGSTETSSKSETKAPRENSVNSIPSAPSPAKQQYYRAPTYVQLVQKPLFTSHQNHGIPQTMLIIAQPALLPHNVVYNQASSQHAQQLLNYFHSNPSAKYQLLYNYHPQQQQSHGHVQGQEAQVAQAYYSPPSYQHQNYQYLTPQQYTFVQPQPQTHSYQQAQYQIPASTYSHQLGHQLAASNTHTGNSHFVPSPQLTPSLAQSLHQVSSQLHTQYQPQPQSQPQPQTLSQTPSQGHSQSQSQGQYSQHYYSQGPQTFTTTNQTPVKTVAPIITGLENFTPEQQAQIKEQLSSHFGGVTQLNSNSLQANHADYQTKFRIEVQSPENEYTTTAQAQTESNSLKVETREDQQPTIQHQQQHHQHQPHYLTTQTHSGQSQGHGHGQQSFTPPVYTYRTPQYTKG